jgi:sporulation protein YlmC with PRC-barrel domain
MSRAFKDLRGVAIRATDGRIGTVSDLYFDDTSWRIRHCVVDTGRWFADRYVLVPPRALSVSDPGRRELWVRLSKSEISRSRSAASEKPVSRQRRLGLSVFNPAGQVHDPHLRSCRAVLGHRLEAIDGRLGRVDDFVIDGKDWIIRQLVVDTRQQSGAASSRVLIAPQHVEGINWPKARISVGLSRATMLTAPTYHPTTSDTTLPPLAS